MKREDFYKSETRFKNQKEKLGINGYMNWEIFQDGKLIQCWNKSGIPCLIQIYPHGNGFQDYYADNSI